MRRCKCRGTVFAQKRRPGEEGCSNDNYDDHEQQAVREGGRWGDAIVGTSAAEAADQARKDAATATTTTMNNKQSAKEADGEM
jgi:hypothetical protein